jgi:hypothetical protein
MKRQDDQPLPIGQVHELEVYDASTGERLGHLGDINEDGFVLLSTRRYDLDETLNVRIAANRNSGWTETAEVHAVAVGSRQSIHTDFYDNEFRFLEPSPQFLEQIKRIQETGEAPEADQL